MFHEESGDWKLVIFGWFGIGVHSISNGLLQKRFTELAFRAWILMVSGCVCGGVGGRSVASKSGGESLTSFSSWPRSLIAFWWVVRFLVWMSDLISSKAWMNSVVWCDVWACVCAKKPFTLLSLLCSFRNDSKSRSSSLYLSLSLLLLLSLLSLSLLASQCRAAKWWRFWWRSVLVSSSFHSHHSYSSWSRYLQCGLRFRLTVHKTLKYFLFLFWYSFQCAHQYWYHQLLNECTVVPFFIPCIFAFRVCFIL